ncbi:bifunctional coenzyme A synthase-like isoform X2 [Dysidea avara]|uniref:bifunctional coenzyme A synthase-like isoform X2 n=1 Tax=Dysidea avara TaxID=196820 RepID=UPI00332EE071
MYRTAALLVGKDTPILPALEASAKLVRDVMYVPLTLNSSQGTPHVAKRSLELLYQYGNRHNPSLDIRILLPISGYSTSSYPPLSFKVDALLSTCHNQESAVSLPSYDYLKSRSVDVANTPFIHINTDTNTHNTTNITYTVDTSSYNTVALGGTFDRIHGGHNLLLTYSANVCDKKVIVGVSDGPLLVNKALAELIEPISDRIKVVQDFLTDVKPTLHQDVVAINDMFGPAGWDPDIDCLVVSQETAKGGDIINDERQKKGLKTLLIETIDLVKAEEGCDKLSSTDLRKKLLGEYQHVKGSQCAAYNPQTGPFIIGLTGGIASGKSSISKRLSNLGAFTVDCDKLGHQAYNPGTDCFKSLVEQFGPDIVNKEGMIDREILGGIVFSDKIKMTQLTSIVWPEIWRLAHQQIINAWDQGYKVCVVDAAVLLEAEWDQYLHEVWVTVVPPREEIGLCIRLHCEILVASLSNVMLQSDGPSTE